MIMLTFASFIASLGFGILFNIRGKKLILASIGGAIGGCVFHFATQQGLSELMSMFLSSILFSLYSEIFARICKTPVTTFIICALIPLVPGGGMYRMMLQAIEGDVMAALTIGLDTLSIAGVLALGILLVSAIMKSFSKRQEKQHQKVGKDNE